MNDYDEYNRRYALCHSLSAVLSLQDNIKRQKFGPDKGTPLWDFAKEVYSGNWWVLADNTEGGTDIHRVVENRGMFVYGGIVKQYKRKTAAVAFYKKAAYEDVKDTPLYDLLVELAQSN